MAEPGFKTCTKCGVYGAHYKNKTTRDGLATQCKACRSAYKKANKEWLSANRKAYNEANKERIKAYYEANKERIKTHYKANKERRNAYNVKYITERCKTDEGFRLGHRCRTRVWYALKGVGRCKIGGDHETGRVYWRPVANLPRIEYVR